MPIIEFVRGRLRNGSCRECLFARFSLSASLQRQREHFVSEIDKFDSGYLSNTDQNALVEYLFDKYLVRMPTLDEAGIWLSEQPAIINISADRAYRQWVDGTSVTYHIPVHGQLDIFHCEPAVVMVRTGMPIGSTQDGEVAVTFKAQILIPERMDAEFQAALYQIKNVLGYASRAIDAFNNASAKEIEERLGARLSRIQTIQSQFKFPLRMRAQTTPVPPVRRKLLPPISPTGPHVDEVQYHEILKVIENSALALERAPSAFATMKEEDVRHHFLIALNAVFEGNTGAEVFSLSGKTDLALFVEGKIIFIAEFKFWKGPKSFLKALTQLLGYTVWRHPKAALIMLNRGGRLSSILRTAKDSVQQHPAFLGLEQSDSATRFRVRLQHRDDTEREVVVTVLVFEVPAPARES